MIQFIEVQDEATDEVIVYRVNDFDGFMDADQAFFFSRQLEAMKSRSYDVKYAELPFRNVFPVTNEAGEGADTITYESYDKTGMSKIISSGYARDLPRADVGGKEVTIPVRELGIAIGWTLGEIRKATRAGKPLNARKMDAAVRGNEQTLNSIAFFGDAENNLIGLFTHPNIPIANAPNGAGGTPEFSTKTVDEILADVNGLMNGIFVLTKMVERPDTLLLPPAQWADLATRRLGENNDTTILEYVATKSPFLKSVADIIAINELEGAGSGATDVMVAYKRTPDTVQMEIPMELRFHPEQRDGLEVVVPAECSTGGLNIYYPLAFSILDNI